MEFANEEAERLNSYLDAHAQGHATDPDGLDPELVATYEQVKTLHARATPEPTLKASLWRNLMSTPHAAIPFNAPTIPLARATTTPRPKADRWRRPQRLMNAFATLALIVAVAGAAYLFNRPPDQPALNAALVATPSTPTATPAARCLDQVGVNFSNPKVALVVPASQLRSISLWEPLVNHVQLQAWTVEAGKHASLPAVQSSQYPGLSVDFILAGFYSAIFDGPAYVVTGGDLSLPGWNRTMVPAGQTVDIGQGDAVVFNYGDGMTVHNASSTKPLLFKRALFTEQPASESLPTGQGFTAMVNQSSVLPETLGELFGDGDGVMVLIPQVVDSSDATARSYCKEPTQIRALTTLEGPPPATPSATSTGSSAPNGYSLWVFPNQG